MYFYLSWGFGYRLAYKIVFFSPLVIFTHFECKLQILLGVVINLMKA